MMDKELKHLIVETLLVSGVALGVAFLVCTLLMILVEYRL
jgi:hypothetical protein